MCCSRPGPPRERSFLRPQAAPESASAATAGATCPERGAFPAETSAQSFACSLPPGGTLHPANRNFVAARLRPAWPARQKAQAVAAEPSERLVVGRGRRQSDAPGSSTFGSTSHVCTGEESVAVAVERRLPRSSCAEAFEPYGRADRWSAGK